MLKIGTFSKLSRISVRMLRYYEEMGLLAPNEVDTATGYRYYGEGQLMEAERIRALREMGFGIGAVREILSACHDPAALEQLLRIRREELCGEIQAAKQRLLLLETTLKRVGKDGIVENYNVTVNEIPGRYAASLRKSIPDYAREGELWGQMMEETAPQHIQMAEPCWSMAIFHDKEYREESVDVEIQMAVKGRYTDTPHVRFLELPPQLVAAVTCKGSYQQMAGVNQALSSWIAGNGYEMDGPMFNIYHVGPAQTQDPEEWITEVCMPVKPRG